MCVIAALRVLWGSCSSTLGGGGGGAPVKKQAAPVGSAEGITHEAWVKTTPVSLPGAETRRTARTRVPVDLELLRLLVSPIYPWSCTPCRLYNNFVWCGQRPTFAGGLCRSTAVMSKFLWHLSRHT